MPLCTWRARCTSTGGAVAIAAVAEAAHMLTTTATRTHLQYA